ncbi:hypothetical protein GGI04_001960 [Coemansia thaxteri]|nr:hypothetical protein GGI04_001960 [Coemansia thaxteri]
MNINGTNTNREQCIRPYRESTVNSPVKNPDSLDLRCRTDKMSADSTTVCGIVAGSPITLEMHEGDTANTRFIDPSHLGPCMVYMAPLSSNGAGDAWFKIYEDGYDPATKTWCTQKLMKTDGKLNITLPTDIPSGPYLLRPEIIALHTADKPYAGSDKGPGAEYYPSCAQIYLVSSSTTTTMPKGYAIPGIYKANDQGILINIYDPVKSYTIPGPPVYEKDLNLGNTDATTTTAATATTDDNAAPTVTTDTADAPTSSSTRKRRPCVKKRRR